MKTKSTIITIAAFFSLAFLLPEKLMAQYPVTNLLSCPVDIAYIVTYPSPGQGGPSCTACTPFFLRARIGPGTTTIPLPCPITCDIIIYVEQVGGVALPVPFMDNASNGVPVTAPGAPPCAPMLTIDTNFGGTVIN